MPALGSMVSIDDHRDLDMIVGGHAEAIALDLGGVALGSEVRQDLSEGLGALVPDGAQVPELLRERLLPLLTRSLDDDEDDAVGGVLLTAEGFGPLGQVRADLIDGNRERRALGEAAELVSLSLVVAPGNEIFVEHFLKF